MAQNKDIAWLLQSHWQRDNSGVTDIYTAQNLFFSQYVERLVGLVCGQSRQVVNHSGFAQRFLCEPKNKSKNVLKYRTLIKQNKG